MAPRDALLVALLLAGLIRTGAAAAAPVPVESAPAPLPAKAQPAPAPPTRARMGVSAAGQLVFGAAPSTLPGIALYLMAELDRGGSWSPALFLGASRSWLNDLDQPRGSASFTLDAASIDACPLRWRFWVVVARPCASALIGRMTARLVDTDAPRSPAGPFAVAGTAFTATFGRMVELSARLAFGVTLIQDSYELGGAVFYRAGPFTTTVSLAFGKSWP